MYDLAEIKAPSTFQLSEMESPWSRSGTRFGAHQYQQHLDDTLIFSVWFAGGLRIPTSPIHICPRRSATSSRSR